MHQSRAPLWLRLRFEALLPKKTRDLSEAPCDGENPNRWRAAGHSAINGENDPRFGNVFAIP